MISVVLGSSDCNNCNKSKEIKKQVCVSSVDENDCGNHHFDARMGK